MGQDAVKKSVPRVLSTDSRPRFVTFDINVTFACVFAI